MAATTYPAGPKGHWLSGNLPHFAGDRLGFFTHCARTYGDFVPVRLGPRRAVILSHPELIEEVLVAKNKHFRKHFALRTTKRTLGNGLLTSEGDFWRRQRRLAQPAFHKDRVAAHAAVMVELTETMLEGWRDGQARDAQDDMMGLTLQVVARTLFGADIAGETAEVSEAMETVMREFTERVGKFFRLPDAVPTPANSACDAPPRRLDRIIYAMIDRRRASGEDGGDLLSMLLTAQDEEGGGGMSDQQLRDEAMTLFMAGHETTANTLAWAWFLLATHPEAEAKLHEELDAALPDRPPTFADLPRLPFAERIITEALRVYPTVWVVGREAFEPCEIGGHRIRVGTTMFMPQWVVHRDPRFFDDPESFRPDRWADGLAKRIPRYAYFPFGGGPRVCIGNGFAMMEAILLLSTIARRYRLALAPDADVHPLATMTLRPDRGVKVIVSGRRNSPRSRGGHGGFEGSKNDFS